MILHIVSVHTSQSAGLAFGCMQSPLREASRYVLLDMQHLIWARTGVHDMPYAHTIYRLHQRDWSVFMKTSTEAFICT